MAWTLGHPKSAYRYQYKPFMLQSSHGTGVLPLGLSPAAAATWLCTCRVDPPSSTSPPSRGTRRTGQQPINCWATQVTRTEVCRHLIHRVSATQDPLDMPITPAAPNAAGCCRCSCQAEPCATGHRCARGGASLLPGTPLNSSGHSRTHHTHRGARFQQPHPNTGTPCFHTLAASGAQGRLASYAAPQRTPASVAPVHVGPHQQH